LKIVTIADTHNKHNELSVPTGDILIHAGDVTTNGEETEVLRFLRWFEKQDFQHKIFIAGNHDFFFERESEDTIQKLVPPGIIYLNDSGTTIEGIKIWGSPITPWFFNWAFNRLRGEQISRHWDLIPLDTDIVITHGPVFRRLDLNKQGQHTGCKDLFARLQEVNPSLHICGHIHESYGIIKKPETTFINASVVNSDYKVENQPIVIELQ
jgi:Icc-related predicted phosphoesterase